MKSPDPKKSEMGISGISDLDIKVKRPLSPHLTVYRFIPTMMSSIMHRITGSALYFGMLILTVWLVAVASGEVLFRQVSTLIQSIPGQLVLFGFTWVLIHHALGGIKHLFWDIGYGFEKHFATKIARLTFVASVFVTILLWCIGYWY